MWDWITRLGELQRTRCPAVVVTVLRTQGSAPREPGAKMIVTTDGFFGTIGGGRLEQLAIEEARESLATGRGLITRRVPLAASAGQCCGGSVELLMETANAEPRLYIYGAGHVGAALARTLQGTPFRVDLIDTRPERLATVTPAEWLQTHQMEWEDFNDEVPWSEQATYAAVMTHLHPLDEAIIADLVTRPVRYIGLIGSEAKWQRMRGRLLDRDRTAQALDRVHTPIGLDLGGGKAPQEIAISIAAGLLQELYGAA